MGELIIIAIAILAILCSRIRRVPSNTVYIVDRNTHYLKTVKHGFFTFNPQTDKITTEISMNPKTRIYQNFFETEDGKVCMVSFFVNYSALNVEDVLYNLETTRRSIDDVIQSSMYHAILSLKSQEINIESLTREFERNINSQVLWLCINVNSFKINRFDKNSYNLRNTKVFTPHKSRSLSGEYIENEYQN